MGGASDAHRYIKKADKDSPCVARDGTFQELDAAQAAWGRHWQATPSFDDPVAAAHYPADWACDQIGLDSPLRLAEHITEEAIQQASRRFSRRAAVASDGIHGCQYAWLPQVLLQPLAELMCIVCATGYAPGTTGITSVPLIPKPEVHALRPIGVFSSLARLLGQY